MAKNKSFLCLDVGDARMGVALADGGVRIAIPYVTIEVDGSEIKEIAYIADRESVDTIVVGYPRNQSGEATAQTSKIEVFADKLTDIVDEIVFQDESLTSVIAEDRLKQRGATYGKADIDMEAAAIILQDYLEQNYG